MSITVVDIQNQLWQEGKDAATSTEITDWIAKSTTQALLMESRLSGNDLDMVVLELTLATAYTFLKMDVLAKLKQDRVNLLIENARAGYNSVGSMTDNVDTFPTKTIGRVSNELLRDMPGSYDTRNRYPR